MKGLVLNSVEQLLKSYVSILKLFMSEGACLFSIAIPIMCVRMWTLVVLYLPREVQVSLLLNKRGRLIICFQQKCLKLSRLWHFPPSVWY